ncbi:hypothetical protein GMD78_17670 [Ornithinibacillus sp. L9]|uniref:Uncharacterized protein n=1 Tax=Ornithinibacillus caprae TaxID=2678566 RepID=A0A6N8FNV5_9BACI|nr:hypothetical protein [Ornithinibacillus caprae]MUK90204.1 hypothetical protein [Ornithinibacillus caprae]
MYRLISFIVLFSLVSVLLYFHQQNSHYAYGHTDNHDEKIVEVPSESSVPMLTGSVHQDHSGSWYVKIQTDNFTFAPESVGLENEEAYHEGHAHLYLNGEKLNRMYGEYYNLDYLDPGTYQVKVTLHANNHGLLVYDGEEIAFEEELIVE